MIEQQSPGAREGRVCLQDDGAAGRIHSGAQINLERPNFALLSHLSSTRVRASVYIQLLATRRHLTVGSLSPGLSIVCLPQEKIDKNTEMDNLYGS